MEVFLSQDTFFPVIFLLFRPKVLSLQLRYQIGKNMKSKIILFLLLLLADIIRANDGSYYVSGNQLIPIENANVRIDKEVLTIRLSDDGYAYVDVYYTFFNKGEAGVVKMGFEASDEFMGDGEPVNPDSLHKGHPFIYDFSVEVNGQKQSFQNLFAYENVKASKFGSAPEMDYADFPAEPITENERKAMAESAERLDADLMQIGGYRPKAHVYYFEANFNQGANKVHHTYRYKMGHGFAAAYYLGYWLTPAMRWAGGTIGDFTLRISTEGTAKHFYIKNEKCLKGHAFKVVKGAGKVRLGIDQFKDFVSSKIISNEIVEVALRDGVVEMHAENFRPTDDLSLISADALRVVDEFGEHVKYHELGSFYNRDGAFGLIQDMSHVKENGTALEKKILNNLPYANRGLVFQDKELQDFYEKQWWYMPDLSYKASITDFTKFEHRLLEGE